MAEGLGYGDLPFLGTGRPVPGVGNIYSVWNDKCMGFCIFRLLKISLSRDFLSKKWIGQVTFRLSNLFSLHGWTTRLLYDDSLSAAYGYKYCGNHMACALVTNQRQIDFTEKNWAWAKEIHVIKKFGVRLLHQDDWLIRSLSNFPNQTI